jgi:ribonuclease I
MQYWNNIRCPSKSGQKGWKNAWETSGVCSDLTESAYFDTALALRDKINPLSRLVSNGTLKNKKTRTHTTTHVQT